MTCDPYSAGFLGQRTCDLCLSKGGFLVGRTLASALLIETSYGVGKLAPVRAESSACLFQEGTASPVLACPILCVRA